MIYFNKTFHSKKSLFIYFFTYLIIYRSTDYIWNVTSFYHDKSRIGASQSIGTYDLLSILLMLIIVLPIFLVLTILASIKYPGEVNLICWNKKRLYWSMFWTLAFLILLIYPAGSVIDSILRSTILFHPELVLFFLISVHYFLYLRASLVMSTLLQKKG